MGPGAHPPPRHAQAALGRPATDFSKQITYNGLTYPGGGLPLGAGKVGGLASGYLINSVQFSDITSQEYLQKRALQDGMFATDIYLGSRRVVIDCAINGTSRGQTFDLLQAWTGAFSPRIAYNADTANVGFLPFTFYQPTDNTAVWDRNNYPNGIPLQVYLRPMIPVHYEFVNNQGSDKTRGWSIRTLTTLMARDPRKYLQTAQVVNLGTSPVTTPYRGDYPTFPVWNGTIASPLGTTFSAYQVFTGAVHGQIQLNLSTYVGSLTFDYATRTLVDGTGTSQAGLLNLIDLTPATNEIRSPQAVSCNPGVGGGGGPFPVSTLTYHEAFT